MNPGIRRATMDDVDSIAPLFNHYRMFYQQPSDEALAHGFIGERLQRGESVIFLAEVAGKIAGFTQLFPS
ncbi:MAG: N-acetyltransferase family protein, partial [Luteimonas sp.]